MSDNDEIQRKTNANIAGKPKFVEFGYIDFDKGVLWFMPRFHYLVVKVDSCFVAQNLEMQLTAIGDTQKEAIDILYGVVMLRIKDVTERGDFSQLIEDAKSDVMDKYWRKFHELEFIAAQKDFNNRKKDAISKVEIVEG